MPEEIPRFFIVLDEEVPACTFSIAHTVKQVLNRVDPVLPDNLEHLYYGDQSDGSAMFGWIALINALDAGHQVALVMRPGDSEPVFPQKVTTNGHIYD